MAEVNISARLICHNALKHMLAVTAPESIFWGGGRCKGENIWGKIQIRAKCTKKCHFYTEIVKFNIFEVIFGKNFGEEYIAMLPPPPRRRHWELAGSTRRQSISATAAVFSWCMLHASSQTRHCNHFSRTFHTVMLIQAIKCKLL